MITVNDAAKQKNCTRITIMSAIQRGMIDAERFGKAWAIVQNPKYEAWTPSEKHQDSGRARWASPSKASPKKRPKP